MTKFVTSKELTTVTKNVSLSVNGLRFERTTFVHEITKEVHPKTLRPFRTKSKHLVAQNVEKIFLPFVKVTVNQLSKYRKKGTPSLVLKSDGDFLYTGIPADLSLVAFTLIGEHKCAAPGQGCCHLSAASDEEGGCAKVRNRATYIERYPWIVSGYETFNTKHDVFVVLDCRHFEACKPFKPRPVDEVNATKLSIAQFVWDDVKSLSEVNRKIKRNKYTKIYR